MGLPLAVNLSKYFKIVGYDNNEQRIIDLKDNNDKTKEIKKSELKRTKILFLTKNQKLRIVRYIVWYQPQLILKINHFSQA